jgi:hypothetical protein
MTPDVKAPTRGSKLPPPFSIRLTAEERARLEADAGSRTLAAHVRAKLFDGAANPSRNRPARNTRTPHVDHAALARVLSALGSSRISSNLNQLAKAANMGALPLNPEVLEELIGILADIRAMRRDLVAAMGLEPEEKR